MSPNAPFDGYRVGLVGCGHIASRHLEGWRRAPGGSVVGVLDLDRARAERLARRFGVPKVYASFDELLADCDAVDVCTPPNSHAALLERSIEAGKRPIVEKPVVVDAAEWDLLRAKIRNAGIELAVAHHLKFTRAFRCAREWLGEGRIGRLLRVDWQFLTSPETDRMLRGGAHWSHELPGGRWFETLPHNLYGVHFLCGAMAVDSVCARRTSTAPPGLPADEVTVVLEREGTIATFHFSAGCHLNQRKVTLTGSTGAITIDILSDLAWVTRPRDSALRRRLGRAMLEGASTTVATLSRRPAYFLDRLRGRTPHVRFIAAVDANLRGRGDAPTPLAEIDYVTRTCREIGLEIERQT